MSGCTGKIELGPAADALSRQPSSESISRQQLKKGGVCSPGAAAGWAGLGTALEAPRSTPQGVICPKLCPATIQGTGSRGARRKGEVGSGPGQVVRECPSPCTGPFCGVTPSPGWTSLGPLLPSVQKGAAWAVGPAQGHCQGTGMGAGSGVGALGLVCPSQRIAASIACRAQGTVGLCAGWSLATRDPPSAGQLCWGSCPPPPAGLVPMKPWGKTSQVVSTASHGEPSLPHIIIPPAPPHPVEAPCPGMLCWGQGTGKSVSDQLPSVPQLRGSGGQAVWPQDTHPRKTMPEGL